MVLNYMIIAFMIFHSSNQKLPWTSRALVYSAKCDMGWDVSDVTTHALWRMEGGFKKKKNNHNCCGFVPISVSNHTPHQYTPMLVHSYHPPFIFRAWGGMKSSIQNHAPGGITSNSVPKNNDCCKHFIASSGGELWSCFTIWPEENLWHLLSIMFLF